MSDESDCEALLRPTPVDNDLHDLQHEDHEDQSSHGEGIVTVVSSSDAAAYRASNVKREKPVDSNEVVLVIRSHTPV
jgi:hypothetical protein